MTSVRIGVFLSSQRSMKIRHARPASAAGTRQGPPLPLYFPTQPLLSKSPRMANVSFVILRHAFDRVLAFCISGQRSLRGTQPQSLTACPAFLSLSMASSRMTKALSFRSFTGTRVGAGNMAPARNKCHDAPCSQSCQHHTVDGKWDGQAMDKARLDNAPKENEFKPARHRRLAVY